MPKITLIEPPYNFRKKSFYFDIKVPLLWMGVLATYLKGRMGDKIAIDFFDGQIQNLKEILNKLKNSRPDFVGISAKQSNYSNSLIIARAAKKINAKVIMGGPYASALAKEILLNRGSCSKDYCVDACVRGDGEEALCEYINGKDLRGIKNLVFVENHKVIMNPLKYFDFKKSPTTNWDLISLTPYFNYNLTRISDWRIFPVYSHKGCFYGKSGARGCIFCGGDKMLRLTPPIIFWQEINNLVKKYRANLVLNFADGFPLDKNFPWFREFYKTSFICKNKPKLSLRTLPRFVNSRTVKILKEFNVASVRLPIIDGDFSSGCAFVLSKSANNKDLERICHPFRLLGEAGIRTNVYFKWGAVIENKRNLERTLKLIDIILKLKNVFIVSSSGYQPMPGSEGWQIILKKTGRKYKNKDLIDWDEMARDWNNFFSRSGLQLFSGLIRGIVKLPKEQNSYQ